MGGGGGTGRGPIHLMPRRCLARLPFVAESAGQTQRTDRTPQDALCAIASHGQQDKAIICLDTSLARSPQLSSSTVDCRPPSSPLQWNTNMHHPGLQSFNNQRTNTVLEHNNTRCAASQTYSQALTLGLDTLQDRLQQVWKN